MFGFDGFPSIRNLYVPEKSVEVYKVTYPWTEYENIIKKSDWDASQTTE